MTFLSVMPPSFPPCCLLTKGLKSIIPGQKGLLPLGEFLPISVMSPAFTGHQTRHNCLSLGCHANDWGTSRDGGGGESPGCEEEKRSLRQRNSYLSPPSPEDQSRPQAKAARTPQGGVTPVKPNSQAFAFLGFWASESRPRQQATPRPLHFSLQ